MRKNKFFILLLGVLIVGVLFSGIKGVNAETCYKWDNKPCPGCQTTDPKAPNYGCGTGEKGRCSARMSGSEICHRENGYWVNTGVTCTCPGSSSCDANSWSPADSTKCSGTSFTQTNDCGNTRVVMGTKSPSVSYTSWVNSSWSECNSSGIQTLNSTRDCTSTCGGTCGSTFETYTRDCIYLDTPYFATLGQPNINISSADLGDTVFLRFSGVNIEDQNITYHINVFNGTNSVWYNPFTWFGGKKQWNDLLKLEGSSYEEFTIIQEDIHRIKASKDEGLTWKLSNNLTILKEGDEGYNENSPIILEDIYPEDGIRIAVNNSQWFNVTATDEDDLLKITWNFGDGTREVIENYSSYLDSSKANVQHNYTSPGIYKWTLTVEEMNNGRNNKNSTQGTIHVLMEGINVFPIISSPEENKFYGHLVQFNASQSYIANCSLSDFGISDFNITDDNNEVDLYCKYILAPESEQPIGEYNVSIRWKELKSSTSNEVIEWIRGNETHWEPWTLENYEQNLEGDSDTQGVVIFKKLYRTVGPRRVAFDMKIQW